MLVSSFVPLGCATLFEGESQTVVIVTHPEGRTVFYEGMRIGDGGGVKVNKRYDAPQLIAPAGRSRGTLDMTYSPSPWLLGDAVLLLPGLVPGLIAFGIDFYTGAWRVLDNPQHVYLSIAREPDVTQSEPSEPIEEEPDQAAPAVRPIEP